ncbi:MAG TPA: tripartite tricarboxylate transporter substrate binding protein [Rubrivivax sp.]|nr:tripartite tricarboxylate transporter substrate binding protein [Rubrivivax sp.]
MTDPTTRRAALGLLAAALGLAGSVALAQTWPAKTITIIVPFPAGGNADTMARVLAEKIAPKLGQNVIVDNKAGAAGILGTDAVAKAKPDGYTLVLSITTSLLINQYLYKKLPYNPEKDLAMVSQIGLAPLMLVVGAGVPAKNIDELKKYLAANKGKVSYGTYGIGSAPHLVLARLDKILDADMAHVPYKGDAPLLQDLVGGQVQVAMLGPASVKPFLDSGKVRAITINGEKRATAYPNVPTLAEQGLDEDIFKTLGWIGIAAPAGTPKAVQQRIADEVRAALQLPDVKAKLDLFGMDPAGLGPDEFTAAYKKDAPVWEKAVKASGATLD